MSAFCAHHQISRKTFYKIRRRVLEEGPASALEPKSRRPRTSPTRISEAVKLEALGVRAALEHSGLDHGPISVFEKMRSMGLEPPSVASLARIFREKGVARREPKKKPRSAYRRFVYPAPNACWQLDGTEYCLSRGRKVTILQIIDDHSRLAVASLVAAGETSEAAITVVDRAITKHGVPQRLLTDNGQAFNALRRGGRSQLAEHVSSLGVTPITGKPHKPTTQGKNERLHQTLFRYLDQQPAASTISELQQQVDEFDRIYNTERPHQGLPNRMTPQQAWEATKVAEPPNPPSREVEPGEYLVTVIRSGSASVRGVAYQIGRTLAGQEVVATIAENTITFTDLDGTLLISHDYPPAGVTYVGNGKSKGHSHRHKQSSPMS